MPNEVTEPTQQVKTKKKRTGKVTIFPNWCKGCRICVDFCPTQVLAQEKDGRVVVARPEACTACGWCELHCPDFAIFVTKIDPEEGS